MNTVNSESSIVCSIFTKLLNNIEWFREKEPKWVFDFFQCSLNRSPTGFFIKRCTMKFSTRVNGQVWFQMSSWDIEQRILWNFNISNLLNCFSLENFKSLPTVLLIKSYSDKLCSGIEFALFHYIEYMSFWSNIVAE